MYFTVRLFILVVTATLSESCDSFCYFIYDNRTGNVTKHAGKPWNTSEPLGDAIKDIVHDGAKGRFTGVVTVRGVYHDECPSDHLRFRALTTDVKRTLLYQSIAIDFHDSASLRKVSVYGQYNRINTLKQEVSSWKKEGSNKFDIQISDKTSNDFYNIFINDKQIKFNYGSNSTWNNTYADKCLITATNVYTDLFCTHYTYIMICKDAEPMICHLDGPNKPLLLGTSYMLTCKGVGSPILEVSWTYPEGTMNKGNHIESTNNDNDVITSTLKIENFLTKDIGSYTCTVKNQNYAKIATKTFELPYTEAIQITDPSHTYYKDGQGNKNFVWIVNGWPLKGINISCGGISVADKTHEDNNHPKKIFTLQTTNKTNNSSITCNIYNGQTLLNTINITKVGYNCNKGQYGENTTCLLCPVRKTSKAGSDDLTDCYNVTSQCLAGTYGEEHNCFSCLEGKTSEDNTVKEGDCVDVPKADITSIVLAVCGSVALLSITFLIIQYLYRRRNKSTKHAKLADVTREFNHDKKGPELFKQEQSRQVKKQPSPTTTAPVVKPYTRKPRPVHIVSPLGTSGLSNSQTQRGNITIEEVEVHRGRDPARTSMKEAIRATETKMENESLYSQIELNKPSSTALILGDIAEDDGLYATLEDKSSKSMGMKTGHLKIDGLYSPVEKREQAQQNQDDEGLYADSQCVLQENLYVEYEEAHNSPEENQYAIMDRNVFNRGKGVVRHDKKCEIIYSTIEHHRME